MKHENMKHEEANSSYVSCPHVSIWSGQRSTTDHSFLLFQLPQTHAKRRKLLLDLVKARVSEVLAAEQLIFRA